MKKYRKSIITVLFLIFLCSAIILIAKPHKEYMSASWSYNYSGLEDLVKSSDFIAVITISNISETETRQNIPFTIYKASVNIPIYGSKNNDSIDLYMTGGTIKNTIYEIKDDPLPKTDSEYLVFCRKNTDGTYTTLSGSQGRLLYKDGYVSSLNVVNEQVRESSSSNIRIDHVNANDIIFEIQSYLTDN